MAKPMCCSISASFLFIALIFAVYALYLYQFESALIAETRKLVILGAIIVLIVAIARAVDTA